VVQAVVSLKPDLVVANTFAIADELKHTAPSVPIVAHVLDPVEHGLVTSLARPEASVTGVTSDVGPGILGKQLDLLLTAAPNIKRVAVLSARRAHAMEALVAAAAIAGVAVRDIPMCGTQPEDY
jgi:putative ABC transport system substrate-binding protein